MAIDLRKESKAKSPTRHAGVYTLPNGRLLARAVVRMPDGKIKTLIKQLPEGATEGDAVKMVETLRENARNPLPINSIPTPLLPTTSTTVSVCCEAWLRRRVQKLKPSTAVTYKAALGKHILPRIGHLPIEQLNRAALEGWVIWIENQRDARGNLYSQDTMRCQWRVLCTAIKDICADLDLKDPTNRVTPPARPQQEPRREQRTLTPTVLQTSLKPPNSTRRIAMPKSPFCA